MTEKTRGNFKFFGWLSLASSMYLLFGGMLFFGRAFIEEATLAFILSLMFFAPLYDGWGRMWSKIRQFFGGNGPGGAGGGGQQQRGQVPGRRRADFRKMVAVTINFIRQHWMRIWIAISVVGLIISLISGSGWQIITLWGILLFAALVTAYGQWGNLGRGIGNWFWDEFFPALGQLILWFARGLWRLFVSGMRYIGRTILPPARPRRRNQRQTSREINWMALTGFMSVILLAIGFLSGNQYWLLTGWIVGIIFFFILLSYPVRRWIRNP